MMNEVRCAAASLPGGFMRRWSIRTRLAGCLALIGVILLLITGIAVTGLNRSAAGTDKVGSALSLTHDAMQAKFRTADFAGWQTGYAFDSLRGIPNAAADDVGQRQQFLRSTAAFASDLDKLGRYALTPAERGHLESARTGFTSFIATDQKIAAGYRKATPRSIAASNQLASGRSLDLFAALATDIDQLAQSVTERGNHERQSAQRSAAGARNLILAGAVSGLLLALMGSLLVVRSITRPLAQLRQQMEDIADRDGDLTQRADEDGNDELTFVAMAFNRFAATIAATVRSVGEQAAALSTASEQLTATSHSIGLNAQETSTQATAAEDASGQVAAHVTAASSGAEEMSVSIREIAQSAASAALVAADAVSSAEATNAIVSKLGGSSAQIGDVVRLIAAVAQQTNLLALNATIEAARAGDAGKGFAVVASEVKDLAQETSRATDEISRQVLAIQTETTTAMQAITHICLVIGQISQYTSTIAAAVEEQSATSADMSRSVLEAATGTSLMATNIRRVAAVSESTAAGVIQSQQAAQTLNLMGHQLERIIAGFHV
jgi:methyl-accepting chemotaxis protein